MGRAPCCDKANVKKGPWSPEEDAKLVEFMEKYGTGGNWIALPQKAGLRRCGKSCRLRWLNYLRPNIKHGEFSDEEDRIICSLYANIGSRWSIIAAQLPGRTDNDIKNYWNTKLKKKLMGILLPSPQRSKQPPAPPPFPTLQTPPTPLSTLSSLYTDSYYTLPISTPPPPTNLFNSNTINYSLLQTQENLWGGGYNYPPVKDGSLIMFGGEASCSSSDGSCSQIKQEEIGCGLQGYTSNGFEENQRFMLDYGNNNNNQNPNGYFGNNCTSTTNTALEGDLEEVKQLINGCSISSSNNINSYLLNDENKTQERDMYYYYY